jgi:hypothetical protein
MKLPNKRRFRSPRLARLFEHAMQIDDLPETRTLSLQCGGHKHRLKFFLDGRILPLNHLNDLETYRAVRELGGVLPECINQLLFIEKMSDEGRMCFEAWLWEGMVEEKYLGDTGVPIFEIAACHLELFEREEPNDRDCDL